MTRAAKNMMPSYPLSLSRSMDHVSKKQTNGAGEAFRNHV